MRLPGNLLSEKSPFPPSSLPASQPAWPPQGMPQFDYACDLDDDIGDDDVNDFGDDGDDGDVNDVNEVNDVGDDGGGFLLAACWPTSQPASHHKGCRKIHFYGSEIWQTLIFLPVMRIFYFRGCLVPIPLKFTFRLSFKYYYQW